MSALGVPYRDGPNTRLPALVVAAALHVGLIALWALAPVKPPPLLPVGSSVPINIVSSAPATNARAAAQAPQTVTAQAPQPAPKAKPAPPAPAPAPVPAFTQTPARAAKPVKPQTQAPSLKAAPPPAPSLDFNKLQQIIQSAQRSAGQPASSAERGPTRAETAPQARPDAGQELSESDKIGLSQLLARLWKLNCDVPGIAGVNPKIKFTVGLDGRIVVGPTALDGGDHSSNPVVATATREALDAVRAAEPFAEPYRGQTFPVNFNAKEACANR